MKNVQVYGYTALFMVYLKGEIMRSNSEVYEMKLEEMQKVLSGVYEIIDIQDVQNGTKITLQNGAIVNVLTRETIMFKENAKMRLGHT